MIIHEHTTEPISASINGAPPATVRQHLETYKITNDKEMVEFSKAVSKGRDIISVIQTPHCTYMLVREFVPVKIALPTPPGQLPNGDQLS